MISGRSSSRVAELVGRVTLIEGHRISVATADENINALEKRMIDAECVRPELEPNSG
ncbi:hypothetical protein [uncultured Jatrophihabitans sp.]|uniref:hypothetical protein n=1 Tax=uncultured Jatrophihabitans sp. TaxID=1610747 RepID=UPI0035CA38C9